MFEHLGNACRAPRDAYQWLPVQRKKIEAPRPSQTAGLRAYLVGSPSGTSQLLSEQLGGIGHALQSSFEQKSVGLLPMHEGRRRGAHFLRLTAGSDRMVSDSETSSRWPIAWSLTACRWLEWLWWVSRPAASST